MNLLTFIIWGLIKIGDTVLFVLAILAQGVLKLAKPLERIHAPHITIASPHVNPGKVLHHKKKLKKNKVLFKARKKRKPLFNLKPFAHRFSQAVNRSKNGTHKTLSLLLDIGVKTTQKTLSAFLHVLHLLVKISAVLTFYIMLAFYFFLNQLLRLINLGVKIIVLPLILLTKVLKGAAKLFSKKPRKAKRRARKPTLWYSFKIFFWGVVFSSLFIFVPLVSLVFLSDLPNPETLSASYIPKTTKIYDRNGILLYEIFANQNRTLVKLDDIPKELKRATIAIEDRDFYTHPGFDLRGIARAAYQNATSSQFQGGSTITQQLIRSALLTPEPTISRKVKEVILAFWAERIYSKDEILEMYFNFVPYGGTAWGVQAASDVYFGKDVKDLDLSEAAFLAGLTQAPSIYSPYSGNGDIWKKRQKEVLDAMTKMGYITRAEADRAFTKELTFKGADVAIKAPHFVMYVKNLLIQKYGLSEVERGGLQVKTTLDLKTQEKAQEIVVQEVAASSHLQISNGAALVLDPRNGDILAMIGSRNYFDDEIDGNVNLTTSLRQPGSTIKIVTYSLALASGFTEGSLLDDSPLTITPPGGAPYTPVNYDGRNHGRVPLRIAFANSYNITAVRVAQALGVPNIVEHGKKLGITTWNKPDRYGVSITLGGADTTMVDLATVYGTVANGGKKVTPDPLLEVKDSFNNVIYQKVPQESEVLNPGVAFIVSDILADNNARSSSFGPNSPLNIPGRRVSVKTGTTDSKRDNWTVGFTPSVVVATWVGNNDNSPMSPSLASGISGAAPMWHNIMAYLLEKKSPEPIIAPNNVVKRKCFGRELYFLQGTERVRCETIPVSPTPPQTAIAR